jgi:hypothetical protein
MMNERLKELALQAGLEMCGCGCDMPTRQSVKFAELIVAECSKVEEFEDCGGDEHHAVEEETV